MKQRHFHQSRCGPRARGWPICHATNLELEVAARDAAIASLDQTVAARDSLIADLTRDVHAFRHSTSWRLTAPLRWIASEVRRARHAAYDVVDRNE